MQSRSGVDEPTAVVGLRLLRKPKAEEQDVRAMGARQALRPVGGCYNVRYSPARIDEFNTWLDAETRTRGLGYADLHDLMRNR